MPSSSQKQHNFMEAAAHDKAFAKEHDIGQSVAKEFIEADKNTGKFMGKKSKKPGSSKW